MGGVKRPPNKEFSPQIKPTDKNLLFKKRDILIFMIKMLLWYAFFQFFRINRYFLALNAYFYTCYFVSTRL